jgi:hypothetical protein
VRHSTQEDVRPHPIDEIRGWHVIEKNFAPDDQSFMGILDAMKPNSSTTMTMLDESWNVSQFSLVHLPNGDFVLGLPGWQSYVIDSRGDAMRQEIALIREIIHTPLLRRLISLGSTYFEVFQKRLADKHPGMDMSHPSVFQKYAYEAIFLLLPDENKDKKLLINKLHEADWVSKIIGWLRQDIPRLETLRMDLRDKWIVQTGWKEFIGEALLRHI